MNDYSYLGPKAIAALNLSDEERIRYNWEDKWIGYEAATEIIKYMEFLLAFTKSDRMPCLLIVGESNYGKSSILRRFLNLHPQDDNPDGRTITAPVVLARAPSVPDEGRLFNNILNAIFASYNIGDHPDKKKMKIYEAFNSIGVKMLIIDDISSLMAGTLRKQSPVLNALRNLSSDLKIPIVAAGVGTALNVIRIDEQLKSRFKKRELKVWTNDVSFGKLLKSFELQLALKKPSKLESNEIVKRVLVTSKGVTGDISFLLKSAAEKAIRSGEEKITPKILDSLNGIF
jgi:type II secretory pathway predicted ATPase ExeA